MKLTIANAALITSLSGFATAATIQVEAKLDVNFVTNAANPSTLGSAYVARIGQYTGGALTSTTVFSDINSSWTNVGSYVFATAAAGGYNGFFAGAPLGFNDAAGLANDNVWVWVSNGTNENFLMQAISGAQAGDFRFKADGDIPNNGLLSIKATSVNNFSIALGSFTSSGANAGYGGSFVLNSAEVIPEPSAALLGAFGAIGLLRRRRN
jgi:hypothetical protein